MCRFTSWDTQTETVVLPVRVVDSAGGLVELGGAPLLVPQVYGLSNAIDPSVLVIRPSGDLICTVRLLHAHTGVPTVGRLVREETATARKGGTPSDGRLGGGRADLLRGLCVSSIRQTGRSCVSRKPALSPPHLRRPLPEDQLP